MSLPWDPPVLLKTPFNLLPHGSQQAFWGAGQQGRGEGVMAVGLLAPCLGSLGGHPPSRGQTRYMHLLS